MSFIAIAYREHGLLQRMYPWVTWLCHKKVGIVGLFEWFSQSMSRALAKPPGLGTFISCALNQGWNFVEYNGYIHAPVQVSYPIIVAWPTWQLMPRSTSQIPHYFQVRTQQQAICKSSWIRCTRLWERHLLGLTGGTVWSCFVHDNDDQMATTITMARYATKKGGSNFAILWPVAPISNY